MNRSYPLRGCHSIDRAGSARLAVFRRRSDLDDRNVAHKSRLLVSSRYRRSAFKDWSRHRSRIVFEEGYQHKPLNAINHSFPKKQIPGQVSGFRESDHVDRPPYSIVELAVRDAQENQEAT